MTQVGGGTVTRLSSPEDQGVTSLDDAVRRDPPGAPRGSSPSFVVPRVPTHTGHRPPGSRQPSDVV